MAMGSTADVYIISASDRLKAVELVFRECNISTFKGTTVAIKANYNSADPFPASTHIDTLRALVSTVLRENAMHITLAERSGMGVTEDVLTERGVFSLADEMDFNVLVLDKIQESGWQAIREKGLHWRRGFSIAKIFTESDRVVQVCCLKTHRFGGHFTCSLKNSVGLVAKKLPRDPYDYMAELHQSPRQRSMIAEINKFYRTDLIIMDAAQAFSTGGPDTGKIISPNVILASRDRVAIDAAGVALLRSYGSTPEVMQGSIFSLEQIARAAELGVGVSSVSGIRLVPLDEHSVTVVEGIQKRFSREG